MQRMRPAAILAALLICSGGAVLAQDTEAEKAKKEANNPLASVVAFNIQNYYVTSLSELDDQNANTFWLRYAQPLPKGWLFRASLPVSRVPTGVGSETTSGLGDLNLNLWWTTTLKSGTMFGVGPTLTAPTATEDETGTDQWQAGLSVLVFDAIAPGFSGAVSFPGRQTSPAPVTLPTPSLWSFSQSTYSRWGKASTPGARRSGCSTSKPTTTTCPWV